MKLKKFRIVADSYAGYECQIWRLWWPFWVELNFTNTHRTLEKAKEFIGNYKKVYWQS